MVLGVEGYSEDLDHDQEHKCKQLKSLIIRKAHLGPDLQANEGQQTDADTGHVSDPERKLVSTMLVRLCQRTPAAIYFKTDQSITGAIRNFTPYLPKFDKINYV